ncbi:sulfite exporter TauE/SafE family protein [Streptobacillus moniliformis]|uniref:sulfite exporter TauE/SafE family protein n=1 Tax=Streptobacillus moniliformis TaxID=34105 RepID=UPI0007E490F0|nr:sulfite exporter TauE/SafE family protein [Streptobacillus moniliformis]
MYIYITYFLIIMFATGVGSLSGMGGGVIIKPSLDALSYSNLDNINFYSSLAVLTMSIVSIIKKAKQGDRIESREFIAIAFGSIIGGKLGIQIFKNSLAYFSGDDIVKLIQITVTVIVLSLAIYYNSYCNFTFKYKNYAIYFLVSMCLGIISTFLGIGGGPINVSLFILIFGTSMKSATLYSISTIFFSQFSKNFIDFFITGISGYDLYPLLVIIPAAILGGNLGTKINIISSDELIKKAYNIITLFVICLNIFNGIRIILRMF